MSLQGIRGLEAETTNKEAGSGVCSSEKAELEVSVSAPVQQSNLHAHLYILDTAALDRQTSKPESETWTPSISRMNRIETRTSGNLFPFEANPRRTCLIILDRDILLFLLVSFTSFLPLLYAFAIHLLRHPVHLSCRHKTAPLRFRQGSV